MGRPKIVSYLASILAGFSLISATSVEASVKLSFSPTGATPAPVAVAPGGSLQLPLYLISTAEKTTGIASVQFTTDQNPGKFILQSRDLTGSSFPEGYPPTFPAQAFPTTSQLGQTTFDTGTTELPAGNYLVGKFTFTVDATAPRSTYVLSTFDMTGDGAYGGGPNYSPITLAPASITVLVPEPSTLALAGIATAALAGRRRRR